MLGCVVAFRELIYWLLTIIGLFTNPAYLLIDIKGDGAYAMFVYILAPEKYVYLAAVRNLKIPCNSKFDRVDGAFMLMILDVFGIAALALVTQLVLMYFITGIMKFNDHWIHGTALQSLFTESSLTRPFGTWLTDSNGRLSDK